MTTLARQLDTISYTGQVSNQTRVIKVQSAKKHHSVSEMLTQIGCDCLREKEFVGAVAEWGCALGAALSVIIVILT